MDLVWNLTGLIQAACGLRTTLHLLIMWVFQSLYVRTDPYGPYGTRRINLRVLACMWPKYTRTPIDRPYSSDRKRVISYGPHGLPVSPAFQASLRNRTFEAYIYLAPCAEDRCMNYTKNYISIRLFPTIKINGGKLAQSLVCCPT